MVTPLVVNASPLIGLGKIDGLWILKDSRFEVHVPEPVVAEVSIMSTDAAARWLRDGQVNITPARPPDPILLAWDLGAGETAVIAEAATVPV